MDWTAILTATISMISAIAVAYISRATKRSNDNSHAVIQEKLAEIDGRLKDQESANLIQQTELSDIRRDLADNNLRTLRLDLDRAIDTDPDNVIIIMEMATKYFVEMHGNCYMSGKFQEWANEHNVNITGLFNQG